MTRKPIRVWVIEQCDGKPFNQGSMIRAYSKRKYAKGDLVEFDRGIVRATPVFDPPKTKGGKRG
jgi:hypothetical protein